VGAASALEHEVSRSELGGAGSTDLAELVAQMRSAPPPVGFVEVTRARAYHALLGQAQAGIGALPAQGASARALDEIETTLRWAGRLKVELVRAELRLAASTLEERLGTALEALPARELAGRLLLLIEAIARAVDVFDPQRGGRLAAAAGLELGRAAARLPPAAPALRAGQAARRLAPGVVIEDWTRRVSLRWLEPDPRVRRFLHVLDERDRALIVARFGFDGGPPVTLDQGAERAGLTRIQAPRRERAAIRQAVLAARCAAGGT
jgi:hypothetical protein